MKFAAAFVLLSFGFLCASFVTGESGGPTARLLVSKDVLNKLIVENKELTVNYVIYNIGQAAASNVEIVDEIVDSETMRLIHGVMPVSWDRIAPGANISHAIVVQPIKEGLYNFTAARITYSSNENEERLVSLSTALGLASIMDEKEYERRYSPHLTDWAIFGLLNIPIVVIPYLMWFGSKSKYYTPKTKKN